MKSELEKIISNQGKSSGKFKVEVDENQTLEEYLKVCKSPRLDDLIKFEDYSPNTELPKCVVTGKPTKTFGKRSIPLHRDGRETLKEAILIERQNRTDEMNDGIRELLKKGIIPEGRVKFGEFKDMKVSNLEILKMYQSGVAIDDKTNLPLVYVLEEDELEELDKE